MYIKIKTHIHNVQAYQHRYTVGQLYLRKLVVDSTIQLLFHVRSGTSCIQMLRSVPKVAEVELLGHPQLYKARGILDEQV